MNWRFWRKKPSRVVEYFYTDYPPIDAEDGDLWMSPWYPLNEFTSVSDIYVYRSGNWKKLSKDAQ